MTLAIPPGVSHGFYTPEGCILTYALTEEYDGSDEFGWPFSDGLDLSVEFADEWPTDPSGLNISLRDLGAARLAEFRA
jgi:dTDP-4-dehydrorhamnose 3,5-epimerase-like enzyme